MSSASRTSLFGPREAAITFVIAPISFLLGLSMIGYSSIVHDTPVAGADVTTLGAVGWMLALLVSGFLFALGATYVYYHLFDRVDGFIAILGIVFTWIAAMLAAALSWLNVYVPRYAASGRIIDDPAQQELAISIIFIFEESIPLDLALGLAVLTLALVLRQSGTVGQIGVAIGYLLGGIALSIGVYTLIAPVPQTYGLLVGLTQLLWLFLYLWIGGVGVVLLRSNEFTSSTSELNSGGL